MQTTLAILAWTAILFAFPLPGAATSDPTAGYWQLVDEARHIDREWQKYLYTATHHDHETDTVYVATLPIVVYKNRPEWRSKAMGFAYWSIIGTGTSLFMVAGFNRRRRRRARQALIVFEKHKTDKDHP